MPKTLIKQNPLFSKKVEGNKKLAIAELFCDTLQGEGINIGVPATFMRLQGCTLQCVWCDTLDVWPNGNEYSFEEIFQLFEDAKLIEKFKSGSQHLVLTGGSPLKQREQLSSFLQTFVEKYTFDESDKKRFYVEIENECVLDVNNSLERFIKCWNNSPKLSNSGMRDIVRRKPTILQKLKKYENSWFKFVIQKESDWIEIKNDFLQYGLINKEQIILMPEGQTQEELTKTRELVANIAIREGVRFTDRLHVTIWNKKTGV